MSTKNKVIIYGSGASANGFFLSGIDDYQVVAVASEQPKTENFEGYPHIDTRAILEQEFDFVIVASWAIHEITLRLTNLGITKQQIRWFQHHKNRVLEQGHEDFFQAHKTLPPEQILYCIYDMNVARATYDIIGFLCHAECERIEKNLSGIHVTIVNAGNNEFNASRWGIQNKSEHEWRIHQILIPSCTLLPSCLGVNKTASREEVNSLLKGATHIFPANYSEAAPVIEYEFNHLFDRINAGQEVAHFRAPDEALLLAKQYLSTHNPGNKKVVTVTLRESISKPARNSDSKAWLEFLQWLDKDNYLPVVIPDTENAFSAETQGFERYLCSQVAGFNVAFRLALYELSFVNLGVNNGPMFLCTLDKQCRCLIYKQIVENYPHSSTQSFIERGFTIGGEFPGASPWQKMVWHDDSFDVIRTYFEDFVESTQV